MARYEEPFETTQALYNDAIIAAGLSQYVHITVLTDNKLKKVFEIVKANKLLKFRTGDDVIIIINENVLEKLNIDQRKIVVEESITPITYNTENDTLIINKPDVVTHSGILSKYGFHMWDSIRETVKAIYKQQEDDKVAAEATKTPKIKKSFKN